MSSQQENKCIAYFQSNPVWNRVLRGFWNKYRSYGSFSGTVELYGLSKEELEELEGFFAKSFRGKKRISISAKQFLSAMSDSCFAGVSPEYLLEHFFQNELVTKKDEQRLKDERRKQIMTELQSKYQGTPAGEQWSDLLEVVGVGRTESDEAYKEQLILGAEMLNQLPYRTGEMLYLAVFATRLTGNPHAFDRKFASGTLLYRVIQKNLMARGCLPLKSDLFPAFYRNKCFFQAGILLDDVSNYTMLSGIRAQKKDGAPHAGMDGFFDEDEIVQIPLSVLSGWRQLECLGHVIYIVENPSVFAALCGNSHRKISCMCMNGQPRLAGLVALELLAASGTIVYYAGDFDPEGLLIAQKLAHFYRDSLHGSFHYWHLTAEDYRACCSKESISQKRLKMLEHITDEELLPVVKLMREIAFAGYQEKLL